MIKVSAPSLNINEQEAAAAVMQSGWVGQGEKVLQFEEVCRQEVKAKHFIALSSCTKAIEVALIVSGCKNGDEVLLPSLTYGSVVQVVLKLGLVPVFVDVEKESLNISINDLEKKITNKSKYILPLHFRGHPCKTEQIKNIAKENNLLIVEDAAHAFGSYVDEKPVGADSFACCFSFGPLKNISCIDGGGIATNDDEYAEKLRQYRNLGMSRSTWQRYNKTATKDKPWNYEITSAGDKCGMNDVFAAVGLEQLKRIDEIKLKKEKLIRNYVTELSDMPQIELMPVSEGKDFLYIFPILVDAGLRDNLVEYLWGREISTAIHYPPNHLQPYFSQYNIAGLPVTEDAAKRILSIPFYTDLSGADQGFVIETIKKFYKN